MDVISQPFTRHKIRRHCRHLLRSQGSFTACEDKLNNHLRTHPHNKPSRKNPNQTQRSNSSSCILIAVVSTSNLRNVSIVDENSRTVFFFLMVLFETFVDLQVQILHLFMLSNRIWDSSVFFPLCQVLQCSTWQKKETACVGRVRRS